MADYKILSVGGSIIIPSTGFDTKFLKGFRSLILKHIRRGEKFILVIGGGATCRQYQNAAKSVVPMSVEDLDWLGIKTTLYNAEFVRFLFKDIAHKEIITNPSLSFKTRSSLVIGAGWKPGCSTDHDTVLLAKACGAKEVFNLSNTAYVYDKDPNVFSDALKIERTNWKHFCTSIVPKKRTPGMHAPFDPLASQLAAKLKLKVSFLDGRNLKEVDKALSGKKFEGTIIE